MLDCIINNYNYFLLNITIFRSLNIIQTNYRRRNWHSIWLFDNGLRKKSLVETAVVLLCNLGLCTCRSYGTFLSDDCLPDVVCSVDDALNYCLRNYIFFLKRRPVQDLTIKRLIYFKT